MCSEVAKYYGAPCVACGEPLEVDDLLSWHIEHIFRKGQIGERTHGKDCTPSCMWCGKTFNNVVIRDAHEADCE